MISLHPYYRDAKFLLSEVRPQKLLKVTKGHFLFTGSLFLRFFRVSNLILPKFGMNAKITKMQIFDDMKLDLILTLTYVLMDNSCHCF